MFDTLAREVSAAFQETGGCLLRVGIGDATGTLPLDGILANVHRVIPPRAIQLVVYSPRDASGASPAHAMLADFKDGRLDTIVRGTLPSSGFLHALHATFPSATPVRLAMLATAAMQDFFLAPVGIDEGFTVEQKASIVEACTRFLPRMGITPSFFLLSAGRAGDRDRHELISQSLDDTELLVRSLQTRLPGTRIVHGEILVENALGDDGCNVIIAPDGVSGNLMYRTLIHLGSGTSRGAWYLDETLPGPVMDTSRVGPASEHGGAIVLAARTWLASRATR